MRKQIFVGVALFWLGVGIGMVAMQVRPKPKPKGPESPFPLACIAFTTGWVCNFQDKELRYDKNGNFVAPK